MSMIVCNATLHKLAWAFLLAFKYYPGNDLSRWQHYCEVHVLCLEFTVCWAANPLAVESGA